jgi:hypothetical protein
VTDDLSTASSDDLEAELARRRTAPAAAPRRIPTHVLVGGIAVAGLVVGSMGPWAKVGALASVSGLDGSNDGWIVIVAAVIAAVGLYAHYGGGRGGATLAMIGGGLALAITVYDWNDIDGRPIVQVGWGLNVAVLSALTLVLAMVDVVFRRRDAVGQESGPAVAQSWPRRWWRLLALVGLFFALIAGLLIYAAITNS